MPTDEHRSRANYDITIPVNCFVKAQQFGFVFKSGEQRNNAGFKMPCFPCTFSNCHLSSHLCGLGLDQWRNGRDGESRGKRGGMKDYIKKKQHLTVTG